MEIFKARNPLISPEELKEFETEIGLSLPEDYKAHMLKYNGGSPLSMYLFFGAPDDGINLLGFYPIKYGTTLFSGKKDYLPENHIGIGRTGTGYLVMSLDEKTLGNIYVHYSEVELKFLAASFTEFIGGFDDYIADFEWCNRLIAKL
ncbi:SMI1 / KNR4 family protein [compost metagenome]